MLRLILAGLAIVLSCVMATAQDGAIQPLLQEHREVIAKSSRKTIAPAIDAIAGSGLPQAQKVLEKFVDTPTGRIHPGILHLYVHLMEMSPHPERALRHGDVLSTLVPDAGHLLHMPTHIDVLCGDYMNVVLRNETAILADRKFLHRNGADNFYSVYRCHNYHFKI